MNGAEREKGQARREKNRERQRRRKGFRKQQIGANSLSVARGGGFCFSSLLLLSFFLLTSVHFIILSLGRSRFVFVVAVP